MTFVIDHHTTYRIPQNPTSPVLHAWKMVERDHAQIVGAAPRLIPEEAEEPADVVIRYAVPEDKCPDRPEAFCFRFVKDGGRTALHIAAGDDLGLVFGMLEYSGKFLGVDPFWFWALPSGEVDSRFLLMIMIHRNRSYGFAVGSSTTRCA